MNSEQPQEFILTAVYPDGILHELEVQTTRSHADQLATNLAASGAQSVTLEVLS